MEMTIANLLSQLERPENNGMIGRLAELKQIANIGQGGGGGIGGMIKGFIMRFAKSRINGLTALSECKTVEDIAEFRQTSHFNKIKNVVVNASQFLG